MNGLRHLIVLAIAVVGLLAFAAVGCSADDSTDAARSSLAPGTTRTSVGCTPTAGNTSTDALTRGGQIEGTVTSAGASRSYLTYVPDGYDGAPTPLVVDLHGYLSGADGQVAMSDLATQADIDDFVVVTPQGNTELPYWNAAPDPGLPDDVQFVSDVIDHVGASLCIDPARVYVDGFSNGAFLASLVACRLSDKVAAVAAVAGLMFPTDCDPARAVPILAIHGTDDQFVSFAGAPNAALETLAWNDDSRRAFAALRFADVTVSQAEWAAQQGCGTDPTRTQVADDVELVAFTGCDDGSTVQLYVVDGGGHTWPGSELSAASASILGPTTFAFDASDVIASFFLAHPMQG